MEPKNPYQPPRAPHHMPPSGHPSPPPPPGQQGHAQPVAYDEYGRPLYAHPPAMGGGAGAGGNEPQMVYLARPINPREQEISPDVLHRHEESKKKYPHLNLSDGEYIINAVKRHWFGLLSIWAVALFVVVAFMGLFALLFLQNGGSIDAGLGLSGDSNLATTLGMALVGLIIVLATAGAVVATYVYNANRFYLTNESVIQEIQTSLFSHHEQTVSLANIEDASYEQNGILPLMFNFGRIRLSTEGDETTYRFSYVANPKRHVAILNNAVEAFKNGRPVELRDD